MCSNNIHCMQQGRQDYAYKKQLVLQFERFQSGPLGGDQEIGAMIAKNDMDIVFFFRDPLTAQPHEPDVTALIRLCDVYNVPVATNMGTAEVLIRGLQRGDVDWRKVIKEMR